MFDLYHANPNDTARFILGKNGDKKLIVIGLNPSTANQEKSDITATKVERVARNHGYGGFVMTNLYPRRATDPNALPKRRNMSLFDQNIDAIVDALEQEKQPAIWAAWGGDIELRPYLSDSLHRLIDRTQHMKIQWQHYGALRKDGHPRHPSRLSYAWQFHRFDINGYLTRFG